MVGLKETTIRDIATITIRLVGEAAALTPSRVKSVHSINGSNRNARPPSDITMHNLVPKAMSQQYPYINFQFPFLSFQTSLYIQKVYNFYFHFLSKTIYRRTRVQAEFPFLFPSFFFTLIHLLFSFFSLQKKE